MSSDAADGTRPQDPKATPERDLADEAAGTAADGGDRAVMGLLSEHVPLSLLVDLTTPEGPHSEDILEAEGVPEDSWWVTDDGENLGSVGEELGEGDAGNGDDDAEEQPGADGTSRGSQTTD